MYGRFFSYHNKWPTHRVMFEFIVLGVQFIRDCPKEPYIPVYMLIGGVLGAVRMFWALYSQVRSRTPEVLSVPDARPYVSPMTLLSIALSCFLVAWFVLGKQFEISFEIIRAAFYTSHTSNTRTFRALKPQRIYSTSVKPYYENAFFIIFDYMIL